MKRMLSLAAAIVTVTCLGTLNADAHTVNTSVLNVRSGAGFGYAILGTLTRGTVVNVVGTSGAWSQINSPRSGWVYSSYLINTPHTGSVISNLGGMVHHYQVTNYFCGPATGQMVIQYVTGTQYSQYTLASYMGTSPDSGTSAQAVASGIRRYSNEPYTTIRGFNRTRVITNINRNRPVPINFNCRYLAYRGYQYGLHHSPIKGYTSGGYYIHDSSSGPNKWATSTEVYNAVHYHYDLFGVRY